MPVCTVTSVRFHPGTAALINSLYRAGYKGDIIIGSSEPMPKWFKQYKGRLNELGIDITYLPFESDALPYFQKTDLILNVLERYPGESTFYFDSDIIILKDWDFFENWASCGIALCSDLNYQDMSENHPVRYYWRELLLSIELPALQKVGYVNSGFIGLRYQDRQLIERWRKISEFHNAKRIQEPELKSSHGFFTFDQDHLNAALMTGSYQLSLAGQEGMGFNKIRGYMAHAIGKSKPWEGKNLKNLLIHGASVSIAARLYWNFVRYPIRIFLPFQEMIKRADVLFASVLSRVIGK